MTMEQNRIGCLSIVLSIPKAVIHLGLYVNESLARLIKLAMDRADQKTGYSDKYHVGKCLLHLTTLVGTPWVICLSNGYTLYPFDGVVLFGSIGLTAHAWHKVFNQKKQLDIFGSARFAELSDMKKLGLVGTEGIVFGKIGNKLIVKPADKDGHVIVLGGPGLGKSKSVAIPTLTRWKGSVVAIDVKGELSQETSMYRQNKVYIFDPTRSDCAQYNPIDQIGSEQDASEMARILCPIPPQAKDPFWHNQAQKIIKACILEAKQEGLTLSQISKHIMITENEKLPEELKRSKNEKVRMIAKGTQLTENTLSGVMAQVRDSIEIFATDDLITQATSRSDWTPANLEGEGASIYLSVPEHLLHTYSKLFAIVLNQINNRLTQRQEKQESPVLMLYDELYSLGTLPDFAQKLSTIRSRNVHCMLFIQSFAQLDELMDAMVEK